ncbi:MAG: nitrous oxide reductase accessory protein NosL [Saprospiraceae bacterium]|nr:nitrous oxide reductase accessory protein NosL [Saprospiraceae bacterium]
MDPKFGAEMITAKGKVYKFDDVNCLVHYMTENKSNSADIKAYYVLDWNQPGTLIDALTAEYIFSENLKTPMASNIAAISETTIADSLLIKWKGKRMNWNDILKYFADN